MYFENGKFVDIFAIQLAKKMADLVSNPVEKTVLSLLKIRISRHIQISSRIRSIWQDHDNVERGAFGDMFNGLRVKILLTVPVSRHGIFE